MFDNKQRIALVRHLVEKFHQPSDVIQMQSVCRFIQNEDLSALFKLVRQLYTLQFSTRKCRHRLIQMQISQSNLLQHIEFIDEISVFKKPNCLTYSHIHNFSNVFSLILILQHFFRIPSSMTYLTNRLNRIHIGHIRYNNPFSLAYRTCPFGIKAEI